MLGASGARYTPLASPASQGMLHGRPVARAHIRTGLPHGSSRLLQNLAPPLGADPRAHRGRRGDRSGNHRLRRRHRLGEVAHLLQGHQHPACSTRRAQSEGGFQSAFGNLDQIAILTTTGDVPDAVAKKLGAASPGASSPSTSSPRPTARPSTLDITAVEPDRRPSGEAGRHVRRPRSIASLAQRDQDRYNTTRDDLSKRINKLQAQVDQLLGAARGPPRARTTVASRRSTTRP